MFICLSLSPPSLFFFFNDTATTEIYTLSLHDALPIWPPAAAAFHRPLRPSGVRRTWPRVRPAWPRDRKSTRLNSSHLVISYAVFCLKKKKKTNTSCTINDRPCCCRDRGHCSHVHSSLY